MNSAESRSHGWRSDISGEWVVAIVSMLIVTVVYIVTMAPDVSFWDSGEFIAAANILGIPHPPGTPMYILIGRVFCLIPFGGIAMRVNLLSAITGSMAAFFLCLSLLYLVKRMMPEDADRLEKWSYRCGAGAGAIFAAFGSTCWINATEAEVYAPSLFVVAVSLWLLLRWYDRGKAGNDRRPLLLIAYILSLSICVHLGTYLALPAFVLFVVAVDRRAFLDGRFMAILLFLTLLGVTVHFYLPIRSLMNPSIDEANPETRQAFMDFLLRKQYKPNNPFIRQASWSFQFGMFWEYFQDQYGRFLPLLGVIGMAAHFRMNRRSFPLYATLFLITSVFLVFYMNFTDHEVRERDYFFAPSFFFWGGWMGIGSAVLFNRTRSILGRIPALGKPLTALVAIFLLALPIGIGAMHFDSHDRRGNLIASDYAWNILNSLERDAVIFTNGDNDTFPLWYAQEVLEVRKDVRVVNLALLNTPWYIWQLKHLDPKIPFLFTDEEIEKLRPYRKRDGEIVLIRDLAIANMLRAGGWQRPMYFAVTVADLMGLDDQKRLSLEGLVYRLLKTETDTPLHVEKCEENLWKNYRYRGILNNDLSLNRDVSPNRNERKLITNYSTGLARLAVHYRNAGKYDDAIRNLRLSGRITPRYRLYEALMGPLFIEAGRMAEAETVFARQLDEAPDSLSPVIGMAFIREKEGRLEEAEQYYRHGIGLEPENRELHMRLCHMYFSNRMWVEACDLLRRWTAIAPGDSAAGEQLKEVLRILDLGDEAEASAVQ